MRELGVRRRSESLVVFYVGFSGAYRVTGMDKTCINVVCR